MVLREQTDGQGLRHDSGGDQAQGVHGAHTAGGGGENDLRALPPTSWAVLGLLSFERELSGYDVKKWTDRSVSLFYWSPSFSQIYSELKRLERAGYVSSRFVPQLTGDRDKRVYRITEDGYAAVRDWARRARVDPPVLKHGVMLRLWLGHLLDGSQAEEILREHRDYAERMESRARADAEAATAKDPESGRGYPGLVLRWAERYYAAERRLADEMRADLEQALANGELETPRG